MLSWLGLDRKAAEKQSGSLVKPSNQTGAAMPRQLKGKKNKMENAMLCQIIITLAIAWYAGAAIIEKKQLSQWQRGIKKNEQPAIQNDHN
jgi:hypothetical protein